MPARDLQKFSPEGCITGSLTSLGSVASIVSPTCTRKVKPFERLVKVPAWNKKRNRRGKTCLIPAAVSELTRVSGFGYSRESRARWCLASLRRAAVWDRRLKLGAVDRYWASIVADDSRLRKMRNFRRTPAADAEGIARKCSVNGDPSDGVLCPRPARQERQRDAQRQGCKDRSEKGGA